MFKIGEFARLTQVSAKALRLYDELGLLKPVRVDPFTDYRFYSADQLPTLHRIIALKELGFSLEQIKPLLTQNVSAEQLKGMLLLKRAEAERNMHQEHARLMRIEAQLQLIELEGKMSNYEVLLKNVAAERVAGVKGHVPSFDPNDTPIIAKSFEKVAAYLGKNGVRPGLATAVYHSTETMTDVPFESIFSINRGRSWSRPRLAQVEGFGCLVDQLG